MGYDLMTIPQDYKALKEGTNQAIKQSLQLCPILFPSNPQNPSLSTMYIDARSTPYLIVLRLQVPH